MTTSCPPTAIPTGPSKTAIPTAMPLHGHERAHQRSSARKPPSHLLPANFHSNGSVENGYSNGNASSNEDSDSSSSNDGDNETDHSGDYDYDTDVDMLGDSDDEDHGADPVEDDESEEDIERMVLDLLEIDKDNEAGDIEGNGKSTKSSPLLSHTAPSSHF
nr:uncharacterized protein LOC112770376 [Arachis hypogaea]